MISDFEINKEKFRKETLDIYDINDLIVKLTGGKYESFLWKYMALIQYSNGRGCIVDYEAVGKSFDSLDEKLKFDVAKKEEEIEQEDGSIIRSVAMFPYGTIKLSPNDIMEKANHHQEQAGYFFKKCYGTNWRCSDNLDDIITDLTNAGYFDTDTFIESLESKNIEDLINEIADYLNMPENSHGGIYSLWNKEALIHDVNDLRGDEWIESFEEHHLPYSLLRKYCKAIGYFADKANHIVADPEEYIKDKIKDLDELIAMPNYVSGQLEDLTAEYLEDICFREENIAYPQMEYYEEALLKAIDELKTKLTHELPDMYLEKLDEAAKPLGIKIAEIIQDSMKDECGPFGGQRPRRKGRVVEMHSQSPSTFYTFHDDGSVDVKGQEYDSDGEDSVDFTFHYDNIIDFLENGDDGWFMYFYDEHRDAYNKIRDLLEPDTFLEEYDRITNQDEEWLDRKIIEHGFKIRSKREYPDFSTYKTPEEKMVNVHYQIVSKEGNKTLDDLMKEVDWIDNLLDKFTGLSGSPCTYNMGLQEDGYISCGFDCRATSDKYKDIFVESANRYTVAKWGRWQYVVIDSKTGYVFRDSENKPKFFNQKVNAQSYCDRLNAGEEDFFLEGWYPVYVPEVGDKVKYIRSGLDKEIEKPYIDKEAEITYVSSLGDFEITFEDGHVIDRCTKWNIQPLEEEPELFHLLEDNKPSDEDIIIDPPCEVKFDWVRYDRRPFDFKKDYKSEKITSSTPQEALIKIFGELDSYYKDIDALIVDLQDDPTQMTVKELVKELSKTFNGDGTHDICYLQIDDKVYIDHRSVYVDRSEFLKELNDVLISKDPEKIDKLMKKLHKDEED